MVQSITITMLKYGTCHKEMFATNDILYRKLPNKSPTNKNESISRVMNLGTNSVDEIEERQLP